MDSLTCVMRRDTNCYNCGFWPHCPIHVALEAARELVRKTCTTGEDGSPVKYGEFDGDGNYILPKKLPNIPGLEGDLQKAQAGAVRWEQEANKLADRNSVMQQALHEKRLFVDARGALKRIRDGGG